MKPGKLAAVAMILASLALAAPFADAGVRQGALVRWLSYRTHASDPETREAARVRLLEIGRPAIDPVLPEIVVSLVLDETRQNSIVFVARKEASGEYGEPEAIFKDGRGKNISWIDAEREMLPSARLLLRESARRELVAGVYVPQPALCECGAPEMHMRASIAVPLEDELAPAIVEAVRKALAEKHTFPR